MIPPGDVSPALSMIDIQQKETTMIEWTGFPTQYVSRTSSKRGAGPAATTSWKQGVEAFTPDGWFRTGDVGVIEDGFLSITDRIKDLMKTSGGKYIAPQLIETLIGNDFYVKQISTIGDLRQYVMALIVPAFDALEEYARKNGIAFSSREELIQHPAIVEFYEKRIRENTKELARYETVKKFRLLPRPFTQEDGEITPTMKLKRKVINQKYQDVIEKMYE
jgi:long-chain acyl-CoA synthetase